MTIPVLLAVAITFTIGWRPFFGARVRLVANRKFEPTPARLERGSYLVNGLLNCMYCHSDHDTTPPGALPKTEGPGSRTPNGAVVWKQTTFAIVGILPLPQSAELTC
jgi:hypothetical protein